MTDLHVVSVSGGKDSTATCLHLRELGIPHRRVFADTGWELPETYTYLREVLEPALGPIDRVRGTRQMEELILHKQMFPSRLRRYCTQLLKFEPIRDHLHRLMEETDGEVVNVIGVRAEESAARRDLPEREWDEGMGCEVWRPLIRWSLQDVIDIHARHNIPPNPLYLQGFTRVGCAPCVMARKGELRLLAEHYPEQIDRIRALERALSGKVGLAGSSPAFFQSPLRELDAEGKPVRPCWPIDKMVRWAKTGRGGRQYELFEPDLATDGCMRWGLCETSASSEPLPWEPSP